MQLIMSDIHFSFVFNDKLSRHTHIQFGVQIIPTDFHLFSLPADFNIQSRIQITAWKIHRKISETRIFNIQY